MSQMGLGWEVPDEECGSGQLMLVSLGILPVTSLEDLIISAFFFSMFTKIDDVRSQINLKRL